MKKFFLISLVIVVVGAIILAGLLWRKESAEKIPQESVSPPPSAVQPEQPASPPPAKPAKKPDQRQSKDFTTVFNTISKTTDPDMLPEEELKYMLEILLDNSAPITNRRRAGWLLAKTGDPEILLELEKIFLQPDFPGNIKAAIAEGLGRAASPQARKLLVTALEDPDSVVVRGAIRGLAVIGDADAIATLTEILFSTKASSSVIVAAAEGLGEIDHPDAYSALVNAYSDAESSANIDLQEDIIDTLAQRDLDAGL